MKFINSQIYLFTLFKIFLPNPIRTILSILEISTLVLNIRERGMTAVGSVNYLRVDFLGE